MTKSKLEVARLARLSKRMLRVKPEHLDMGAWAYKTKCGTVACLLGHAGLIPEFRALGLVTHARDDSVSYHVSSGSEAGRLFFGLSNQTADMLFSPGWYSMDETLEPKLIADRIDTLIDVGEEIFAEMVKSYKYRMVM